jgi:phosphoribosylglycinamide formyltransferase 1
MTLKLGFLASHGGSAMRAVLEAIRDGTLDAEARLVISNNEAAPALDAARAFGAQALHLSQTRLGPGADLDRAIAEALAGAGVEWVVLSGYMRKLGPETLRRFRGRIINVHPALLPRHGGRGFYGSRVHAAVIAAGDTTSGATVHLVDEEYDRGAALAQREIPVLPGETAESLERRVREIEPPLVVETLRRIASGDLRR